MGLVIFALTAVLLAVLVHQLWQRFGTDKRIPATIEPRVALAAMMVTVAGVNGRITNDVHGWLARQLADQLKLTEEDGRRCIADGRRLCWGLRGDLNARLHRLRAPIERNCSPQERQDVIDLLFKVAGRSAERNPTVRDALGRISGTLLRG